MSRSLSKAALFEPAWRRAPLVPPQLLSEGGSDTAWHVGNETPPQLKMKL